MKSREEKNILPRQLDNKCPYCGAYLTDKDQKLDKISKDQSELIFTCPECGEEWYA